MQLQSNKQAMQESDAIRMQQLENELLSYAHTEGKQQGMINKPGVLLEFQIPLNNIQTKIQGEINTIKAEYLVISGMVVANTIKKEAKEKTEPIQAEIKDVEHERKLHEGAKKQCTPDLSLNAKRKWVYCADASIAITEAFLAYEALRIAGLAKIPSIATAVGIGVAIGFGTVYLGRFIKHAATRKQLLQRYTLVLIPAFIGFLALGNMRAAGYATTDNMDLSVSQNDTPQTGISGITLTIISFLIFLIGLIFSIRFAKSREEEAKEAMYNTACQQEDECKQKIHKHTQVISQIQQNANNKSSLALQQYEYALAMEDKLISLGKKTVDEFIATNLRYRTDNTTPDFFANPPQMHYNTFFDNLKNNAQ